MITCPPFNTELLANPQAAGLEVAFVLGENRSSGQPSLRECQQYGAGHGILSYEEARSIIGEWVSRVAAV